MSDILIRSMEMPKKGKPYAIFYDGEVWCNGKLIGKATELPKHGRLIDADALVKNAVEFYDPYGIINGVTLDEIDDAPTIIPASGGDEPPQK